MKLKVQDLLIPVVISIGISLSFMFVPQIFFLVLENTKVEFPSPN